MCLASKISLAEKFKLLRKANGITQEVIAQELDCVKSRICEIEKGKKEYEPYEIPILKKLLCVENAPILEDEITNYINQLELWQGYIKDLRMEEAKKIYEELSVITKLSYEKDLNFNYRMIEAKLLMRMEEIPSAEEVLENSKSLLREVSEINVYHYYLNMGMLNFYKGDHETSKKFYKTADDIEIEGYEKDDSLTYNLGLCYTRLGMSTMAIITLLEIYNKFSHNNTSVLGLYLDNTLAVNYIRIGKDKPAKKLLEKALARAKAQCNKIYTGHALQNLGCAYRLAKDYKKAIEYFDQSLRHYEVGDKYYLDVIYEKIICLIADGKKESLCQPLLLRGTELSKSNEQFQILFQSLSHLLSLDNTSAEYIKDETIPWLIKKHDLAKALYFCNKLIEYYTSKNSQKNKSEVIEKKSVILEKMIFGGEIKNAKKIYSHCNFNCGFCFFYKP